VFWGVGWGGVPNTHSPTAGVGWVNGPIT
jgi:hypothetical protein